ncbi:ATP-dependent DNA helicase [Haladaptatus sp. GCM10025707]|uniref:ATP-dependent DNA helicase n=1 Tax=unclassified Haladaptatus TaxID=2622732 RepID=UPI0023E82411|nr:ATP-dependent DNA helicase [Haladaptatus sp. QDMS2]
MSDQPGATASTDADWRDYFGFDAPYDQQAKVIERTIRTARGKGYFLFEGPCGTGKTMAALTAASYLVRETDLYDRVVVVTPVKQQLAQFVADMRALNAGREEPLSTVALDSKGDLCPYEREGIFPEDASVHDRCEDLRDQTSSLVKLDDGEKGGLPKESAVPGIREDAEKWWDPARAEKLAAAARQDAESWQSLNTATLETAGAKSPYPTHQPTAPDDALDSSNGNNPLYCPFEADWYARDKGSPVGFADAESGVVTIDELLPQSVEHGTCPHRVMQVLLQNAEVVIGNYMHLFDRQTRVLTDAILDENTFVIVDEAHRVEERVRDILSDRIGLHSLRRARGDLRMLVQHANKTREHKTEVEEALATYEVSLDHVRRAIEFYDAIADWLDERITAHLDAEFDDWQRAIQYGDLPEEDIEIPLRPPETEEVDALSAWAEGEGYGENLWQSMGPLGVAAGAVLEEIDPNRSTVCGAVGTLLTRWWTQSRATYFRELVLEYSPKDLGETANVWERAFTPALVMYNCLPAAECRDVFETVGGGVLMSATLEPLSVFQEVVGLDEFDADRPVDTHTFDLRFPRENRATWGVDLTPFTARNRGSPTAGDDNAVREEYAYALRELARSPGNVLICMPNYREATWAAERLRAEIDKPVLVDESSSNEETEALKQAFFDGEEKVLVTSTRGTLTEGVDYDGDKLGTCAVVGVPLVNTRSPRVRAVRNAYADAFGPENAFEYALTVPAVRRTRQALGRVIRGPEERGVRALLDQRYCDTARRDGVRACLSAEERTEQVRMTPMFLDSQIERFWNSE